MWLAASTATRVRNDEDRLIETLAYGAIPVVLADEYVLPFSEVLDWTQFSVRWPYARVSSLVPYLRTISAARVCRMRRRAHDVWRQHFSSSSAEASTLLQALAKQANTAAEND